MRITPRMIGIIYIPTTIFQINERRQVTQEAIICIFLSESKYCGQSPTIESEIIDKKGRN